MPRVGVRDPLGDIGRLRCLDDDAMELPRADRLHRVLTGEQPAVAMHHTLFASNLPPLAQQREQVSREQRIAVLTAFALLDSQQHALAVDVAHLEHRDLGNPQARAVSDRQRRLVLEA